MNVFTITEENFAKEVLEADRPVLLDFWAAWCGPCQMVSPVIDEIADENPQIKVGKINVDRAAGACRTVRCHEYSDLAGHQRWKSSQEDSRRPAQGSNIGYAQKLLSIRFIAKGSSVLEI